MLMAQLDIDAAAALARLRAQAYASGRSATDVARDIIAIDCDWSASVRSFVLDVPARARQRMRTERGGQQT